MKNLKIALIIVLILLLALPLFGQRRGRRRAVMKAAPVTLSLYGGLEDFTEEDNEMYYSFGGDVIIPFISPLMLRLGFVKADFHDDKTVINLGTDIGGELMYYWQGPMAFIPYGFGGLWYNSTSSSELCLRLGAGGQMRAFYNFFVELGLDFKQTSNGDSESYTSMFVHAGVRFPLFR